MALLHHHLASWPFLGASVQGAVWLDDNANGQRVSSEQGQPGVPVQLLQGTAVVVATVTDAAGQYAFSGIAPGVYAVRVVPPSGLFISPKDQGLDDMADSDVDPLTGQSPPFTLQSGQTLRGPDTGLFRGVSVFW